jgi:glutathione S-transferase
MTVAKPQLFGAGYSVYVRIARLALAEKGVDYDPVEIDIFGAHAGDVDYLKLNPFARIPTFRHGDFAVFETAAITRYVDEAFPGPALQPAEAQARARMTQMISIMDGHLYRPLVWGIYVATDEAAKAHRAADAAALSVAMAKSRVALTALSELSADGPYLLGDALSLADLHLLPMLAYGCVTTQGRALLAEQPRLTAWFKHMNERESVKATRFVDEGT